MTPNTPQQLSPQRDLRLITWMVSLFMVLGIIISHGMYKVGVAHGQTIAVIDAGAATLVDAGSAAAPPVVAVTTPTSFPDPTTNPLGFADSVVSLWHSGGWATALMLVLVGLFEGAAALGKNSPTFAWLGKGRVSIGLAGGLAVATAALAALVGGGQWAAVLTALVTAALAFWHQAGTDPAKA